jgi:hypothetical protein
MKEFETIAKNIAIKLSNEHLVSVFDIQKTAKLIEEGIAEFSDSANFLNLAVAGVEAEMWYNYIFVQNEVPHKMIGNKMEGNKFIVESTPVVPGTLTGAIYEGDEHTVSFAVQEDGTFHFHAPSGRIGDMKQNSKSKMTYGKIVDYNCGEFIIFYPVDTEIKLEVNYEYETIPMTD